MCAFLEVLVLPGMAPNFSKPRAPKRKFSQTFGDGVAGLAMDNGLLQDDTDVMELHAKRVVMHLRDSHVKNMSAWLTKLAGPKAYIRAGSLCTGSGIGELSFQALLKMLARVAPNWKPPDLVRLFFCETW